MQFFSAFRFSYARAFRVSLLINVVLIVASIVMFFHAPVSAVTLRVVGSADDTTSYRLDVESDEIIYVYCADRSGTEAQLGYLSNVQALTCPG